MLATFVEVLSVPLLVAAGVLYLRQRMSGGRQVPVVAVVRRDGTIVEMPADDERIQRHL